MGIPSETKESHTVLEPITDIQTGIVIEGGEAADGGLKRALKERHVTLISLSSVISAGAFYGFGYALYLSGPVGALIGFGITGFMVWALMQSLGEVTTMFPIPGGFIEHASRFVDPAFSFAMAWLYYFMWSVFLGSEWNGAVIILQYWVSDETVPLWAWTIIFFVFFVIITNIGVAFYGELEFWIGWFKLLSLAVCFFVAFLVNVGALGGGYIGFRYWTPPTGPVINGINGFGQVFVLASTYYVGTEIVSLAAGETKDPRKAIPSGVRSIVYRILFIYIGIMFWQGLICPSNSPDLLNANSTTASSPFTIGFTNAGWKSSGDFLNVIITIAFISASNGCIYVQARAIHALAISGRAPKIFAWTSKRGVPHVAITTSCCWGFLALMNLKVTAGALFTYFVSVGGTATYIAWGAIIFTQLRVRKAMDRQGIDHKTYPFKAWGSIWIYRFNLFLCIFLLFIQGFVVFESPFNWKSFIADYITIPTSIVLFVGYKLYHKTRWVRLDEMDFSDRLVKLEDDDEPKKAGLVIRLYRKIMRKE